MDETNCQNCQALLAGKYCHVCGQRGHVHRTLASLGHDLAHGVLHFEGKIWRTLPLLAWRPGEVTRRYIAGERVRFVSPLALFLFSVFMLALILGSLPGASSFDGLKRELADSDRSLEVANSQTAIKLSQAIAERDTIRTSGGSVLKADRAIAELQEKQKAIRAVRVGDPTQAATGITVSSKLDIINERWKQAKQNPDLLIYKLKNSAYKYSWMLVPMSVPFVWLLFPFNRRFGLYDHAIFVIYSLASMSLLTIVLSGLMLVPALNGAAEAAFLILPPLHMYRQLRGAYSLSRASALWRTMLLAMMATIVFVLWVAFLMLVGAA